MRMQNRSILLKIFIRICRHFSLKHYIYSVFCINHGCFVYILTLLFAVEYTKNQSVKGKTNIRGGVVPVGFDLKNKTIEFPDFSVEKMVDSLFMYIESKIEEITANNLNIEIDWIKDHFFALNFLQQLLKKHKNVTKKISDARDSVFNIFSDIYSAFEKTDTNKKITKIDFENFTYCMQSDLSFTLKSETIKRIDREKFTGDYYSFDNIEPLIRRHKLIAYYGTTLRNGYVHLIEVF